MLTPTIDVPGGRCPLDVSLILTLHTEGPLLRRTLLSLEEAALYARRLRISVELVAVLDRADAATRLALDAFDVWAFDSCTRVTVDHGSLGLSRNSGIAAAQGRYAMMCDGDDLISFNAVAEMVHLAEAAAPGTLVFPEYLLAFGDRHHFVRYQPLSRVTPLSFLRSHPFVSRVFADRRVFRAVPYLDVRLSSGYAYEDWHFNAECAARGHDIRVARDTMLFYRQRPSGLLGQATAMSVRQIPPTQLFQPATFRRVAAEGYLRTGRARASFTQDGHAPTPADLDRPVLRELMKAANAIDPAIEPAPVRGQPFFSTVDPGVLDVGRAYYEACGLVAASGPFDEVFLLPFLGVGGAETFLRDVIGALVAARPGARVLALLGEAAPAESEAHALPVGVTVLDIAGRWPDLDAPSREIITLRLIETLAPAARLHIRDSAYACAFFRTYWPVLRGHASVFYRFSDAVVREGHDLLQRATGFTFVSAHIEHLAMVVTDTETLVERDRARVGLWPERFQCLYGRRSPMVTPARIEARARRTTGRLLWASRLDWEKRPGLIPLIARQLAVTAPGAHIDVFGRAVLGQFDAAVLDGLDNLTYRGGYTGFDTLDHDAYDAFVYTSWYDGLPNVVLEAIAAGLPVIVPSVGGLGELVTDDETGVLLPLITDDEAAARAYADAAVGLLADAARRARLAESALRRLVARHGDAAHARRVNEIFFPSEPER